MADALYHRVDHVSGDAKPVRVPGTVAAEIKAGDFVVLVTNKAIRASSLGDSGTKAQNQEAAHDIFLGICIDGKLAGETKDVLVATEGRFRRSGTVSGAIDVGGLMGLLGTGTAGAVGVSDVQVENVATPNLAVGTLARNAGASDTSFEIELAGVLTTTYRGCQAFA